MKNENIIKTRTLKFSLMIIDLYKDLEKNKEYVISKQLLRSATSIGANVIESEAAYSKRDFIHKLSVAAKEAHESKYWLTLLSHYQIKNIDLNAYQKEIVEIINILTSIIKTSQERYNLKF